MDDLTTLADDLTAAAGEPDRLNLTRDGEYGLYLVLRDHFADAGESAAADATRDLVAHLNRNGLLPPGWSRGKTGQMKVTQTLLTASWLPKFAGVGFPADEVEPAWLFPAVDVLAEADA